MNHEFREEDYLGPDDAELDARLRQAFGPARTASTDQASSIVEVLPSEPPGSGDHPPIPFDPTRWVPFVIGLAAGLLVAFALFMTPLFNRPKVVEKTPPAPEPTQPIDNGNKVEKAPNPKATRSIAWARITRGAVALADTKGLDLIGEGEPLESGQRIVTGDGRLAVIELANGLTVELDRATGVRLDDHTIRFEYGGLAVSRRNDTPEPRGMLVEWQQGSVESKAMVGDAIEVRSTKRGVRVTSIRGPAQVTCLHPGVDPPRRQLRSGDQLWITEEGPAEVEPVDPWVETAWRLPLADENQQSSYVSALIAEARRTKRRPSEGELAIRGLGARGGELALGFLDEGKRRSASRRLAATLASELVTARSVDRLIDLLGDSDGAVRSLAQRGLVRLTGEKIGGNPDRWRDGEAVALKSQALAQKQWRDWWAKHRLRFLPTTP
ncbi:MAG: hypothetical protein AAF488_03755 [Planctomycetota bacterium]